jgi:Domain of unknown function (DUF4375)
MQDAAGSLFRRLIVTLKLLSDAPASPNSALNATLLSLIFDGPEREFAAFGDRLLADPASPSGATCHALLVHLGRRERALGGAPLMPVEVTCLDALDIHLRVYCGGFMGWILAGYGADGESTLLALQTIGATRTERLARRALRAISWKLRAALDNGAHTRGEALPEPEFGPRRESYFARLDDAFYDAGVSEELDERIVAYAREHGIKFTASPAKPVD